MSKIFYVGAEELTLDAIEHILCSGAELKLSDQARERIQKCRDYIDNRMEHEEHPIYGINTGFGSLCEVKISHEELGRLQENLVKSHACSVGEETREEIVKLMLLLKAHALSLGYSGVQVATVERMLEMYNRGVLPVVFNQGSLGASGDLAPLANLFLPLIGEGEVNYNGKRQCSREVLKELGWEPIKLQSKEGLALLNGTQFMSSNGVYALLKAYKLMEAADFIGAISLEAFDGRIEPFHELLHKVRPHQGQIDTAQNFRELLKGSELIEQEKEHVQDPYSFRCIPQVHGATKDTIAYVGSVLMTEINSVTDNPTVFIDEELIISGGNFHGQPIALAFDFLAIALAELGNISERRVAQLISGVRGLPAFLVADAGLNSGFMIPQYAAASIVSQNKMYCFSAASDSIESCNGQEDHVSMGANAATKLHRVEDNLEQIFAIELLTAAQAMEFRRPAKSSPQIEKFLTQYRQQIDYVEDDVVMYQEIEKSRQFILKHFYES